MSIMPSDVGKAELVEVKRLNSRTPLRAPFQLIEITAAHGFQIVVVVLLAPVQRVVPLLQGILLSAG